MLEVSLFRFEVCFERRNSRFEHRDPYQIQRLRRVIDGAVGRLDLRCRCYARLARRLAVGAWDVPLIRFVGVRGHAFEQT
ncbi:hypothetical protein ACFQL4_24125 [Halosimplex aquaticum]